MAQRTSKTTEQPELLPLPEPPEGGFDSLTAAMAWVQANLPHVGKGSVNDHFKNRYADLADLSQAILPLLGRASCAFICSPYLQEGAYVLRASLRHVSGEEETAEWPLPQGNPQQVGSALTYGRRYLLSAMTGIAPDDDDGAAAAQAYQRQETRARAAAPREERAPEPAPEVREPDLDGFMAAVTEAVVAESKAKLSSARNDAESKYGVLPTTLIADEVTGVALTAVEYLRAALEQIDLPKGKVTRVSGEAAKIDPATAQWVQQGTTGPRKGEEE